MNVCMKVCVHDCMDERVDACMKECVDDCMEERMTASMQGVGS